MAEPSTPRVRVVVVNFEGGRHLGRCLDHLEATEWPPGALDIVVVDNASTDGSPEMVEREHPGVRLVRAGRNLGFAGGNNLALTDLETADSDVDLVGPVDLVGLVNPDAFVEPGWLAPLVDAVAADPSVGAANPKLLLAPRFVPVAIETEPFEPGSHDTRTLGAQVTGVRRDGGPAWDATVFGEGFFDLEVGEAGRFRWSAPAATLFLPLPDPPADGRDGGDGGRGDEASGGAVMFEVDVAAEREKPVTLSWPGGRQAVLATPAGATVTVRVAVDARGGVEGAVDVVNSAGSDLVGGAFGADRGFGEPDDGRYDEPAEVFAWTGACVVLDAAYLADVGLFDPSYFMYSEDFDLSWRGRLRGWRYRYVPESRVRHVLGAVAGQRTAAADVHSHRNALVTLVKNAPAPLVRRELRRYVSHLAEHARFEVVDPLRRRRRPRPVFSRRRARVVLSVLARLPRALAARRRIGRHATVSREAAVDPWTT